jgi:hypothetical protein
VAVATVSRTRFRRRGSFTRPEHLPFDHLDVAVIHGVVAVLQPLQRMENIVAGLPRSCDDVPVARAEDVCSFSCVRCGAESTAPMSQVALPAHARQRYGNGLQLPVLMESGTFTVELEP